MPVRYAPAAIPANVDPDLRVYLGQETQRIAGSQPDEIVEGAAILSGAADDLNATDLIEEPVVNYADSFDNSVLGVDAALGTITLPNQPGLVEINTWISIEQITAVRDFSVLLLLESNGVWSPAVLATGYVPQQGTSVGLGIGISAVRGAVGSEVLRLGVILDNKSAADFQVIDSTFEVSYVTVRG